MNYGIVPVLFLAAVVVLVIFAGTAIYHRYTGLTGLHSLMLFVLTLGVGLRIGFDAMQQSQNGEAGWIISEIHNAAEGNTGNVIVCLFAVLSLAVVAFVTNLYRKWIRGYLTEAEKLPGIEGVRAWLSVGNVISAIIISFCLCALFDFSFLGAVALMFGLVLVYPLLKTASQSIQVAPSIPAEDFSKEREKVLQLLEMEKITADETAELLNALSHSVTPPPKPAGDINPQRKIVLLGAALLLVGFFLPWFSLNPGDEVNALFTQFQQSVSRQMPVNESIPTFHLTSQTIQVKAGDLDHGLGWWILSLGITAAVLPFFATNLNVQQQKKVMLACLGAGAIILLYLFTNNFKIASVGIILGLAGYTLEFIGALQERSLNR